MSFLLDFTNMIATATSMTLDIDIFYGDAYNPPDKYVLVRIVAGGTETESGVVDENIQIICQDVSYILAETLANFVHSQIARKPGFSSVSVFYCDVIMRPFCIDRQGGKYVFSATYLVKKRG